MTIFLVLAALLLLVSGVVKVKAAERVGMGLPILPLIELVAGLAIFGVSFTKTFTPGQGFAVVVAAVALVLGSSIHVGMGIRRRQRLRTRSEGTRLANYVQYLSRHDPPSE